MKMDIASLILRVGFGGFMLLGHGLPKVPRFFAEEIRFATVMGMPPVMSLMLAVFAEVICAIAVIIGFKTKWASVPLVITMLVAALYIHANDPWLAIHATNGNKEFAMLFALGFAALFFLDSGRYSVDRLMHRSRL